MNLKEFTSKLQPGINLGNTLENVIFMNETIDKIRRTVTFNDDNTKVNIKFEDFTQLTDGKPKTTIFASYEQLYRTPEITKENINYIASLGFRSVRLPVCMSYHYNWNNRDYDEYWINHIKNVVDYIIESGMICVISLFHEQEMNTEVSVANWQNLDTNPNMKKMENAWKKLCDMFKEYSTDTLAFELVNEMRLHNYYDTIINYDYLMNVAANIYKRLFDVVRNSGGNNSKRFLGIYGYTCDYDMLIEKFAPYIDELYDENVYLTTFMFDDVGFTLCCGEEQTRKTWGTSEDKEFMENNFKYMSKAQDEIGRPIVIAEYGIESYINCDEKSFLTDEQVQQYRHDCIENVRYTVQMSNKYNIPAMLWDTNYFVDRRSNQVDQLLYEAIFENN